MRPCCRTCWPAGARSVQDGRQPAKARGSGSWLQSKPPAQHLWCSAIRPGSSPPPGAPAAAACRRPPCLPAACASRARPARRRCCAPPPRRTPSRMWRPPTCCCWCSRTTWGLVAVAAAARRWPARTQTWRPRRPACCWGLPRSCRRRAAEGAGLCQTAAPTSAEPSSAACCATLQLARLILLARLTPMRPGPTLLLRAEPGGGGAGPGCGHRHCGQPPGACGGGPPPAPAGRAALGESCGCPPRRAALPCGAHLQPSGWLPCAQYSLTATRIYAPPTHHSGRRTARMPTTARACRPTATAAARLASAVGSLKTSCWPACSAAWGSCVPRCATAACCA